MFSGGASAAEYLSLYDKNWGEKYDIVCGLSNKKKTKGELFFKLKRIPFIEVNAKEFCRENGFDGLIADMPQSIKEDYFYSILRKLNKFKPDLIILSGFMLVITEPLLGYVPIINVHPADLSIKDPVTGKPKYVGDDAVRMAIEDDQKSTASTIHVVSDEVDCGEIICISNHLHVPEGVNPDKHQNSMKSMCDGPAYIKALALISSGEFKFN